MDDQANSFLRGNLSAVQFDANKDFQTKGINYEGDSGFLRYNHRWLQPKGDTQANREILTTLLSTQGENSSDYVEKLIAENISYRDLASLSHTDLELMGFKHHKQRDELMKFFRQLPNQDPSYENICSLTEASNYNRQIINSSSNHLETMRSALSAANYKLQIMPPDDVIVGEKSFASRFVLEALNGLNSVTQDIDRELIELEEAICSKIQVDEASLETLSKSKPSAPSNMALWFLIGSLSGIGILGALYYFKFKN